MIALCRQNRYPWLHAFEDQGQWSCLNKIYTRTGDDGKTGLSTGERVEKFNLRIQAYGTVDETNATLGMVRQHTQEAALQHLDEMLARIQNELFDLGADLCTPDRGEKLEWEPLRITASQVERLEKEIDALNEDLEPLRSFILPGGHPAAGRFTSRPHGEPARGTANGRVGRSSRRTGER